MTKSKNNFNTLAILVGWGLTIAAIIWQAAIKDATYTSRLDFIEAESKGKYINSIKNNYEFDKLEEPNGTFGLQSNLI